MTWSALYFASQIARWLDSAHLIGLNKKGLWETLTVMEPRKSSNDDQGLELNFSLKVESVFEHNEGYSTTVSHCEDVDDVHNILSLDHSSSVGNQVQHTINIRIDICLHPSYQIPSPFISIWDQSGTPVSISILSRLIDHDVDFMSSFVQEENPLSGRPCYTIHSCGIDSCMDLMGEQSMYHSDSSVEEVESRATSANLLQWFTIVGPMIGLPISPQFFIDARRHFDESPADMVP